MIILFCALYKTTQTGVKVKEEKSVVLMSVFHTVILYQEIKIYATPTISSVLIGTCSAEDDATLSIYKRTKKS